MRRVKIIILFIICSNSFLGTGLAETFDPKIYKLQKTLKELGYDPGLLDGVWGKKTKIALKSFQRDNGLPAIGQLDAYTKAKLNPQRTSLQVSLKEAVKERRIITVKALIAAGEDMNARDKFGETLLHMAAVRGYQEIASMLIAGGADVNAKDERGMTPLHAAAWSGHKETATLLLSKGSGINAKDEDGVTPLHVSALSGNIETMVLLINSGAEINAKNQNGMTPLHAAALTGQKEAVKLLIEKGADVRAQNDKGVTPLQMAFHNGHESIVELMRNQDVNKRTH
jgi:ankyrin repeat protein